MLTSSFHSTKLIIRSHEGPDARDKRHDLLGMDNGYTIDHEVECGKLITLFSAPDYPQFQVIIFASIFDIESLLGFLLQVLFSL
jgi:hypothetical protein